MLVNEISTKMHLKDSKEYCENGLKAEGYCVEKKFLVLYGSQISYFFGNLDENHKDQKQELLESSIIDKKANYGVFTQDYEFTSISLAACILRGRECNGRELWKFSNGLSLNDISGPKFKMNNR